MKLKSGNILLVVGLFLLATVSLSYAQEASSFPIMEEIIEGDREKSEHLYEEESKIHQKSVRDSIAFRHQVYKPKERLSEKQAQNPEEEALSFNFLYYIIQRVKMSDIMDE